MKIKHVPLCSIINDTATGLTGMLTHLNFEINHARWYNFQPHGLNPKTGQPVDRFWIAPNRIQFPPPEVESDLPLEVLGTEVKDLASGFCGTAIGICLHSSGCVHVSVQPKGRLAETGAAIATCDFDIRRLSGPALPVLTESEIEASQKAKPSPSHCEKTGPRAL